MVRVNGNDMRFEAGEAERVFDFVNVAFGAFLGAFLGVELAGSDLTPFLAVRLAVLLVVIAFVGLSLRGLCLPLIHGHSTLRHSLASIVTLSVGAIAFLATCSELGYPIGTMSIIGGGWLLAPLIGVIPLMARRWIHVYD